MPKSKRGKKKEEDTGTKPKQPTAAQRMSRIEADLAGLIAAVHAQNPPGTLNISGVRAIGVEQTEEEKAAAAADAAAAAAAAQEAVALKEKEEADKRALAAKNGIPPQVPLLLTPPSAAAGSQDQLDLGASVSLALNQMLGADGGGVGEIPASYFLAGTTVDKKIKLKIWSREYVELGSLVHKPEAGSAVNMGFSQGSTSHLSFTPARPRQPANVYEWLSMFAIYSSIYTQKFPAEAPGLFTYITRVMGITKSHPHSFVWRIYDEKFRRLRQYSDSLPWHLLDHHVLHESQEVSTSNKGSDQTPKGKGGQAKAGNSKVVGHCYAFNRVTGCRKSASNCNFRHVCAKCGAPHPGHKCSESTPTRSSDPSE